MRRKEASRRNNVRTPDNCYFCGRVRGWDDEQTGLCMSTTGTNNAEFAFLPARRYAAVLARVLAMSASVSVCHNSVFC